MKGYGLSARSAGLDIGDRRVMGHPVDGLPSRCRPGLNKQAHEIAQIAIF